MAFTVSHLTNGISGNERYYYLKVTADDTTGNVQTPLSSVKRIDMADSVQTTGVVWSFNELSVTGATAAGGYIAITNCTSGDVWYMTAYGG